MWHVTDSKTIRLRVNEDIIRSLLNEDIPFPLLGQKRYLNFLDGTRRSESMGFIIHGHDSNKVFLGASDIRAVEIKLVPLPSGLPPIELQCDGQGDGPFFPAKSLLLSHGAPGGVLHAQPDHKVAIIKNCKPKKQKSFE